MSVIQAIILGIVQGLTEFLPISSSGHLILVPWLFDWDEPGLAFDAALHLGTLVAVFTYFWRDLLRMLLAVPIALRRPMHLIGADAHRLTDKDKDGRLALLLVLGSVPGGIAGLLLQDRIDSFFHGGDHVTLSIALIAVMIMVFGLVLFFADRRATHRRGIADLGPGDAIAVGVAQALALFPGVSRSGITLTAGLLRGIKRADAARFSFLLGTPLVTLAGAKGMFDLLTDGAGGVGTAQLVCGVIASAISGFLAIGVLLRFLQTSNTLVFTVYRLAAGAIVLLVLASGIR